MRGLNVRIWQLPTWLRFAIAIASSVAILVFRANFATTFGDRSPYVFSTIAVAVSALLGGFWPGVLAGILSLVAATYYFVEPLHDGTPSNQVIPVVSFGIIWLFISMMCDLMRRVALNYAEAAEASAEQKARLEHILSGITDGFFAVDKRWNITHTNATFDRLLERAEGEMIGERLWDVFGHQSHEKIRTALYDAMQTGERVELDVAGRDGRWYNVRGFPNDFGLFVYIQDIHVRKEFEERQQSLLDDERRARTELEQTNRMKDEFVATLSHELRTPLTTILGWSELLQGQNRNSATLAEGLNAIERSTRLQTQLIEDLLDMSRIANGKMKLNLAIASMCELAAEAVESARPQADIKNIELSITCDVSVDTVRVDPDRMHQVFSNLLSNAIKFTPAGGHIAVSVGRSSSEVTCSVDDDGEGIDAEFLPYLFERFRQANSGFSRRHGGLGLGLTIVRQLVEMHGGHVAADSKGEGKGSHFEVRLPLAVDSRVPSREPEPILTEEVVPCIEGVRLLIVEDDGPTRILLHRALADYHCEVQSAASGREGLALLATYHPDVIISDIGMPEMDGYDFIRQVRNSERADIRSLPAIALTAFAREIDRKRALEAGFQGFQTKPVTWPKLIGEIARLGRTNPAKPEPISGQSR